MSDKTQRFFCVNGNCNAFGEVIHKDCKGEDPAAFADFATCMADVDPETVRFLWHPYIPLGKLTILEGDPGEGKSYLSVALGAAVSSGRAFPNASEQQPGDVLFLTAEDGLGDTLRPRLDELEADVSRCYAYDAPLTFAERESLEQLALLIRAHEPRLVIIDPIVAYLGARTDAHRANEVRSILAPIASQAEQYGCAIVVVRHLSKAKGGKAIYRGLGSIDFVAAARSVLLVGSDRSNPSLRAMVHTKSNLAPKGDGVGYAIDRDGFRWTGETTLTAADLLAGEMPGETGSKIADAREFLRDILHDGPVPSSEVISAADEAGIAERTLREAKKREGIAKSKEGFGNGSVWYWHYPEDTKAATDSEGCKVHPLADNVQPSVDREYV